MAKQKKPHTSAKKSAQKKETNSSKGGRPTVYTLALVQEICRRIAEGEGVVTICKDESMPSKSTVYSWLLTHEEFLDIYEKAREMQADTLADETLSIPDELFAIRDTMGATMLKSQVELARLRFDARKWVAGKLKPQKYSDRLEHTGKNGGPIQAALNLESDDKSEARNRLAERLRKKAESNPTE